MRRVFILGTLAIASLAAPSSLAAEVIFLGGRGSTEENVQSWTRMAQSGPYGASFHFAGVPFPTRAFDVNAPETSPNTKALVQEWADRINRAPAGSVFVLAGHSSGSFLATAIARVVKDPSRVRVVLLDGGQSPIPRGVDMTCWYARERGQGLVSLNRAHMRGCGKHQEYAHSGCGNSWCLHFSLINRHAAEAGINGDNFRQNGYKELEPNLVWLEPIASSLRVTGTTSGGGDGRPGD